MCRQRKMILTALCSIMLCVGLGSLLIWRPGLAHPLASSPRPTLTPIPRPTLTPVSPQPTNEPTTTPKQKSSPPGARIILSVQFSDLAFNEWWTVIQWQDSTGGWHDTEGWRGQFNQNGQVKWWVGPKDFGTGPFRWAIYKDKAHLLWDSDPFTLPHQGEILEVRASM